MATYSPTSLNISPPAGGFQQGGWYAGRQYWGGTLSDPGVIHPSSNQQGAGQAVSAEVNRQSAAQQGVTPQQFEGYLQQQRQQSASVQPVSQSYAPSGPSGPPGTSGAGIGFQAPEAINLPDIYKNLFASSGIKDFEATLAANAKAYSEQVSKIKDNPYLSEATMTGRIKKIDEKFSRDNTNLQNQIATKKADIETQLNLQLKQFDINSQQAQQALSQFNTLLNAGALQGASGEDIANITRSTGISSSMIQSAIGAQNKKNNPVKIDTFTAENGEVFAVAIDSNGNLVNKQSLGTIGNVQGKSGGSSSTSAIKEVKSQFVSDANSAYGQGDIFPTLVQQYAPYLSLQDIYRLYSTSTPGKYYGKPVEDASQIQAWYNQNRGK